MVRLETMVNQMGPLIDAELDRVDRKHGQLGQLSADFAEAVTLYHSLMRDDRFHLHGPLSMASIPPYNQFNPSQGQMYGSHFTGHVAPSGFHQNGHSDGSLQHNSAVRHPQPASGQNFNLAVANNFNYDPTVLPLYQNSAHFIQSHSGSPSLIPQQSSVNYSPQNQQQPIMYHQPDGLEMNYHHQSPNHQHVIQQQQQNIIPSGGPISDQMQPPFQHMNSLYQQR